MSPARTLVASYCFPPYSDTAAVVAAKRVREQQEQVDVICNAMDSVRGRDPSLIAICGDLVQRFTAVPSPTAFSNWPSTRTYVDLGYRTALRWQREQGNYEHLYSRAQFGASHFLAGRFKASHPDVEWTAEFSDPLSRDVLGKIRHADLEDDVLTRLLRGAVEGSGYRMPETMNANEWCEVIAFALADQIIFTNELQRQAMLSACHDPTLADRVLAHSVVSPHPTLPREFYTLRTSSYELPTDRINIGYFGNFYANRGVGLLLDALRGLPTDTVDRLRLHVFTSRPKEISDLVRGSSAESAVVANPYVNFLDFLALTDRMDLLLVNDAITPEGSGINPFLPSKWSDYKGSRAPVWAIVEEGSSLDREPGITYRTPVAHLSAIQQVLTVLATDGVRANVMREQV